jgi:hypothetical protein
VSALQTAFFSALLGCSLSGCTLETGENFQVAEVVYDEAFFYCEVEPMLFAQGCGAGDPARGETAQGCHFNRQGLRLTDYSPRADTGCIDNELSGAAPAAARSNYQSAQLQMDTEPERAPLLQRPTSASAHPRVVFDEQSPEAEIIRAWATRYSSQ